MLSSGSRRVDNTADVESVVIRQFEDADRGVVLELWRRCDLTRPWNDPNADIDRKLGLDDGWFFVAVRGGEVVASAMAGYDGHRGWINYLAVDPSCQRSGVGRLIVERAEAHLFAAGCPKVNLQIRAENAAALHFYERLGYAVDEVVSMGKRLIHDAPTPEP